VVAAPRRRQRLNPEKTSNPATFVVTPDDAGDLVGDGGWALYPAGLRLRGWRVVVVGGGAVAERRIARLIAAGAEVTLIAPEATDGLMARASAGDITWERRRAEAGDFAGARLALICTDDPAANAALAGAARAHGALVNRADDPDDCDFLVPAVANLGPVQVAVLTGGVAPTVGRYLCAQIERSLGAETGALVALAARVRAAVRGRARTPAARAALMTAALDEEVLTVLRSEGLEAAYAKALRLIELVKPIPSDLD
jgi:siroheme synthase-like protein